MLSWRSSRRWQREWGLHFGGRPFWRTPTQAARTYSDVGLQHVWREDRAKHERCCSGRIRRSCARSRRCATCRCWGGRCGPRHARAVAIPNSQQFISAHTHPFLQQGMATLASRGVLGFRSQEGLRGGKPRKETQPSKPEIPTSNSSMLVPRTTHGQSNTSNKHRN